MPLTVRADSAKKRKLKKKKKKHGFLLLGVSNTLITFLLFFVPFFVLFYFPRACAVHFATAAVAAAVRAAKRARKPKKMYTVPPEKEAAGTGPAKAKKPSGFKVDRADIKRVNEKKKRIRN